MESLCERIKTRLKMEIEASATRRNRILNDQALNIELEELLDNMADFLVEKFNNVWGI